MSSGPVTHVIELTGLTLEVVVNEIALFRLASEEIRGQHQSLPQCRRRSNPMRDVLAPQAIVGHDRDGILGDTRLGSLGIAERRRRRHHARYLD
jgi:hypothetical protein